MFSAQTLRAKVSACLVGNVRADGQILYDLTQLPREALPSLRDSLLGALGPLVQPGAPAGSRAVLTQLALALADLALQMPEWTDVVQGMIKQYGNDPSTVMILLRFLSSLAEESLNPRLPTPVSRPWGCRPHAPSPAPRTVTITMLTPQDEGSNVIDVLVSGSAEQVINVLSMYIQAPGESCAGRTCT